MTTTWLDTPLKKLDTHYEALDFLTERDVWFINVSYTARPGERLVLRSEECVYRDGVFLWPFLRSTRIGNTFSVVREGGWPGHPVPHVQEKPASNVGGQPMGAIYEVDLTAQPTQAMTAAGSYTVDGKTWWAKGPIKNTGGACGIVNGLGLLMSQPSTVVGAGISWRGGGNVIYPDRLMAFPVAQLANYNPLAPLAVVARVTGVHSASFEATSFVGLCDAAQSAAQLTAAEKATALTMSFLGGTSAVFHYTPHSPSQYPIVMDSNGGTPLLDGVALGVYRFGAKRYFPLARVYAGSIGSVDESNAFAIDGFSLVKSGNGQSNTPSFIWVTPKGFNDAARSLHLTHVKLFQPKVAA